MVLNKNSCRLLSDVGGTFLKSVVATTDGELIPGSEGEYPMPSLGTRAEIEAALKDAVAYGVAFARKQGLQLVGIGVAIPGPFDYATGIPRMTHKFRNIYGVSLRELFSRQPGVGVDTEIVFMQDVNAALAGEIAQGNAIGYRSAALISLGTGLGFAVSRGQHVLCNEVGGPIEVIFNRIYHDGILEDYASKRGFLRAYNELTGQKNTKLTVADLGRMAKEGDATSRQTFATVGEILAMSLHDLLDQYGVECLLFSGQISKSFCWMERAILSGLRDLPHLTHIGAAAHIGEAAFYGVMTQFDNDSKK